MIDEAGMGGILLDTEVGSEKELAEYLRTSGAGLQLLRQQEGKACSQL